MQNRANIILVILLFIIPNVYAQRHLSFMGVQMGQDIKYFTDRLTEKGLNICYSGTHLYGNNENEYWTTLSGAFWEFDFVDNILVKAPFIDKGVTLVQVMVRVNNNTYKRLISALDLKYGHHQRNTNIQYSNDVQCVWITSKGNIEVWRSKFSEEDTQCNLEITYKDFLLVQRVTNKRKARSNDL